LTFFAVRESFQRRMRETVPLDVSSLELSTKKRRRWFWMIACLSASAYEMSGWPLT
jgi:hypothetical protein